MKRFSTLALAAVMLLSALTGCTKQEAPKQMTPEERTALYETAIKSARSEEDNQYNPITTKIDESSEYLLGLLNLTTDDMSAYALSVSMMNVRAYGIAAIYPAAGKDETVTKGLNGFIDQQKQNFEQYLADQYDIANSARLETLEDGTILMVMCEGQDAVFDAIKDSIEGAK